MRLDHQAICATSISMTRAYAAWRGARPPTEDEWQWTESEHRDGRTRWAVLKGGSQWYVDGGPREPSRSLRYLLTGAGTSRSATIGCCTVDLHTDDEESR